MLKSGKIPMIAMCAAMLTLLASCTGRSAPVDPVPTPLETAAVEDWLPEVSPGQEPDGPVPSEEPIEETTGEANPIPFFVPDPDPDDPTPTSVPIPEHDTIPIPFLEKKDDDPPVSGKISDPDKFEDGTQYFGRWIVQDRGIDVACYLCISQEVVDTEDAASFFQYGDQYVIADHSNQDFRTLSSCQPGDLAYLETDSGVAVYVCTAVFQGHNTEDSITDNAGNSIEYGRNTGGVTCYTCNDNWQNISIVLFSPITYS